MIPRVNILGVGISAIDPPAALDLLDRWVAARERHYVCVCAVHIVMECQENARLRAMVNHASLAVPDGMPLVWVSRLAGQQQVQRVYGPDLMLSFCELAALRGYTSYLLGGAPGQPEAVAERLRARFPSLSIVGMRATPERPLPQAESEAAVAEINALKPDVVWVGMGAPLQEQWMALNRDRIEAPLLVGVGAAFDFHSARIRQAPTWMQHLGLEWLFRLAHEPGRLWRRYLLGNPAFLARLLAQGLGLRKYHLDERAS
ncbi:MAG TPA: WecB/TagA/CpsF family glycosyltransferase [Anaerolineae bacterium]|nr:WecB/TagA/CpsF family glycosyltransferase [Anaerolineae bacterium]